MRVRTFIGQLVSEVLTWQNVVRVTVSKEIGNRENISFFITISDGSTTVWTQPFFTDEIEIAEYIWMTSSLTHMGVKWNYLIKKQLENREKIFGNREDEK